MKNHPILAAVLLFLGATLVSSAADGKAVWADKCAKCHGEDAKGDTKMGKKLKIADLSDAKAQAGFTDADAAKAVEDLTDDDIKAVIAHLRTLKQ